MTACYDALPSPPITDLPEAPSPSDSPSEFETKAYAFVAALEVLVDETNAAVGCVDTMADAANTSADSAASSATSAENSATAAAGSANYLGTWSSLSGSVDKGASVLHQSAIWLLLVDLADITASEPSGSNSDWYLLNTQSLITFTNLYGRF